MGLKFIVAVDAEGLACVVGEPGKGLRNSRDYRLACREAVREANAAARALFDSGARRVIVWDNHNGSLNMNYEDLDSRVEIALGIGVAGRFPGLDESFTGVLLIGYHARDNTADAVMAHTYSSATYQSVRVNGREMGEIGCDAAIAGEKGVPVILVCSDDKGVAEAKEILPWVETVATKESFGWNCAISKHPVQVEREIYEATKRAISRLEEMKPFRLPSPVTIQIRFKRIEEAQERAQSRGPWSRVDPYTVEGTVERISQWL